MERRRGQVLPASCDDQPDVWRRIWRWSRRVTGDYTMIQTCDMCRMYFYYIYKASININFLIKITVNYHVIDFYINFHLIYIVTVFIFVQNFITCKITYYFNSKVSPFLKFNISLVKQNICALCFIFLTFKLFISSAQLPRPMIKFGDLSAVWYSILSTCSQPTKWQTTYPPVWWLWIN